MVIRAIVPPVLFQISCSPPDSVNWSNAEKSQVAVTNIGYLSFIIDFIFAVVSNFSLAQPIADPCPI